MANTPRTDPLLAGTPTAEEIAIVDEALTAYECAHRYGAALESPGPERSAGMARARTAARMLERLVNNGAGASDLDRSAKVREFLDELAALGLSADALQPVIDELVFYEQYGWPE